MKTWRLLVLCAERNKLIIYFDYDTQEEAHKDFTLMGNAGYSPRIIYMGNELGEGSLC